MEPFFGEIRIFSFNFPPKGWAFCNGQLLPINQNQALFSLLGTTYGGNGQTTFALPNMQGSTPIHNGSGHTLGERGGETAHTITTAEMPTHTHVLNGSSSSGSLVIAAGNLHATSPSPMYRPPDGDFVAMNAGSLASIGGSQAHTNLQPYLVLNFCIALQGIFPSPT